MLKAASDVSPTLLEHLVSKQQFFLLSLGRSKASSQLNSLNKQSWACYFILQPADNSECQSQIAICGRLKKNKRKAKKNPKPSWLWQSVPQCSRSNVDTIVIVIFPLRQMKFKTFFEEEKE